MLTDKNILLCVTGGIAAYKAVELARLFKRAGANIHVVMTKSATEFVGPLTFQSITGHEVRTELFDKTAEAGMGHIELARWADQIVVAPASAHSIAKLAYGLADDLLTTLWLASSAEKFIVPAMNMHMWENLMTQRNIDVLEEMDINIIGPEIGEQACGDYGYGRMSEPQDIFEQVIGNQRDLPLLGLRILLTAGPTREYIDPVRYITNRSSGKMGYALAKAAKDMGAEVILVSGPCHLMPPKGCVIENCETALEMKQKVENYLPITDIFIGCAAVADYRLEIPSMQKLKKQKEGKLTLHLIENPDILKFVADSMLVDFVVGFAAETHNLKSFAQRKLKSKKIDMIVANEVGEDKGFDKDEIEAYLLTSTQEEIHLEKQKKSICAQKIMAKIQVAYAAKKDIIGHSSKIIQLNK